MPLKFWDEAFLTAVFLINRLPTKVLNDITPFYRLYEKEPDYSFLRTFGCACWPNLRPYNNHKLRFRSKRCVFLGYSNSHKGFKCLEPSEGRVYISRDVVFDETVYPFSSLHPNAGARLRSELALLPDILKNPSSDFGDALLRDQHLSSPTNGQLSSCADTLPADTSAPACNDSSCENPATNAPNSEPGQQHFMCNPGGNNTEPGVDHPGGGNEPVGESALGSGLHQSAMSAAPGLGAATHSPLGSSTTTIEPQMTSGSDGSPQPDPAGGG
jgi:hypothetical protein